MFPTTYVTGYNMLYMAQPVCPVLPVLQPVQGIYGAPPMVYGVLPVLPAFYQPAVVLPQRPMEFCPQGNYGRTRETGDFSVQPAQGPCSTLSSPCPSQESSSGYSSDSETGSSPGLAQYRFREAPPAAKRLPIFEAVHKKGLKELQDRQRVPQNAQMVPCPEGKSKLPEEKKLHRRFKTIICKNFMAGSCPYGDDCNFAHGENELRVPELPKNYKTRPCANFMLKNFCQLGKKCDFIH